MNCSGFDYGLLFCTFVSVTHVVAMGLIRVFIFNNLKSGDEYVFLGK